MSPALAFWALDLLLLLRAINLLLLLLLCLRLQHVEDAHGRLGRGRAPKLVAAADEKLVKLRWRADRMGGEGAAAPAGELRGRAGGGCDEAEGVGQRLLRGQERDRLMQLRAGGDGVADVERCEVGALDRGQDVLVQPKRALQVLETGVSVAALRAPVAAGAAAESSQPRGGDGVGVRPSPQGQKNAKRGGAAGGGGGAHMW